MTLSTVGRHRKQRCQHQPTGTVAWPAQRPPKGEVGAATYSCSNADCVWDAACWVREQTGHMGTYRPFNGGDAS